MEIFSSLLIFLAPYGATDSSPAGCSRLAVGSGWRGPEKRGEAGWSGKCQQTSSGPACHLRSPVHLCANRPASPVRKHTHTCHKLSTADSERVFQRGSGVRRGALLSYVVPVRGVHSVWQVTLALRRLWGSECVFVCPVAEGRIHRKMWEAFLCYWRVEEWMGGFHPGLSLIREAL